MSRFLRGVLIAIVLGIFLTGLNVGCEKKQPTKQETQPNSKGVIANTQKVPEQGKSNTQETTETVESNTQETTEPSENNTQEATVSDNNSDVNKNMLIYVREGNEPWWIIQENEIFKSFVDSGYSNLEVIKLDSSIDKAYSTLAHIKKTVPGVVIISGDFLAHNIITKGLKGTNIPTIAIGYVEQLNVLDEDDNPQQNITGIKTFSDNIEVSAVKLLDFISPIYGKKAVFINDTSAGLFPKKNVEAALNKLDIELKEYVVAKTAEDFKSAVLKYNADKEVGWILVGIPPQNNKNIFTWFAMNSSKPSVSFTEAAGASGILCSLGVDPKKVGSQAATMALGIMEGQSINSFKAEQPKSINIFVNIKTAKQLGIELSNNILGSANKVFTDYKGSF